MAEGINLPKEKIDSVVAKGWNILVDTELGSLPFQSDPYGNEAFQILGLCSMRRQRRVLWLHTRIRKPVGEELAGALFETDADELSTEQVHDAVAELTNIFTGNIRAVLPETFDSDLPMVVSGEDLTVTLGDMPQLYTGFFRTDRGILEVGVRGDV